MILSHKYKFIFLKTAKTAGTSIEIALSKFCGKEDIITPDTHTDNRLRKNLGYPGPQNYLIPLKKYTTRNFARIALHPLHFDHYRPKFYHHMPASLVRQRIDPEIWNTYYKFCFSRNPWDRFISLYYWYRREGSAVSSSETKNINAFVQSCEINAMVDKGWDIFTHNNNVIVDHVCRYENMQLELEMIQEKLGLPSPIELPRAKGAHREDRRHYRDVLDDNAKRVVADLCSREIEYMKYEF